MATFTLDIGSSEVTRSYPNLVTTFENQMEQRRQKASRVVARYRIKSPALNAAGLANWRAFFDARTGSLEKFDITDETDDAIVSVRMEQGSYRETAALGHFFAEFECVTCNEDGLS